MSVMQCHLPQVFRAADRRERQRRRKPKDAQHPPPLPRMPVQTPYAAPQQQQHAATDSAVTAAAHAAQAV